MSRLEPNWLWNFRIGGKEKGNTIQYSRGYGMDFYRRPTLAKQLYWTKRTELAMEHWNRRKDNGVE
jgi:hypothetical protein